MLAASGSAAFVSERFGVSISYVVKARQRRDRRGDVSAGVQTSHTRAKLLGHDDALREQVLREPDATLAELRVWAAAELGVSVSITAMWTRLRRLKLTLKKRRSLPPSGSVPMSLRRASNGTI